MFKSFYILMIAASLMILSGNYASAQDMEQSVLNIGQITKIIGPRDFPIEGFGLVTGLKGTGDKDPFVLKKIAQLIANSSGEVLDKDIQSKSVAWVRVNANLPAFGKKGFQFDVQVSSMCEGTSLKGGVLRITALTSFNKKDPRVLAFAQGDIPMDSVNPTKITIKNGGVVHEALAGDDASYHKNGIMTVSLREPSFSTVVNVSEAINKAYVEGKLGQQNPKYKTIARALDAMNIEVRIPDEYLKKGKDGDDQTPVNFIKKMNFLEATLVVRPRVIVNRTDKSATMKGDVRISNTSITLPNLAVKIENDGLFSPLAKENDKTVVFPENARTLERIARVLNDMGSEQTVVDVVTKLNEIGAIQADVEIKE